MTLYIVLFINVKFYLFMENFVVKISSEEEARHVLKLAFDCGWKWWDDENAPKPSGQKMKNLNAPYLYFGRKGPGLISWFERVKRDVPPAHVLNPQAQLSTIINNLKENTILHIGKDEIAFDKDRVIVGCKRYKKEAVLELLELSKRAAAIPGDIIFHANGDVTSHNRRVSAFMVQHIADQVL